LEIKEIFISWGKDLINPYSFYRKYYYISVVICKGDKKYAGKKCREIIIEVCQPAN
jgi:phage anti-repressor protein